MRFILGILFLSAMINLHAQEEISSFFYPDILQSGQINPSYTTGDQYNIGIGSFYYHLDVRGPKVSDLFKTNKYLKAFSSATGRQYLRNDISFNIFDLAFKTDFADFRIGYNGYLGLHFDFSPELITLLSEGNASSIGKTFEIGPDVYLRKTSEFYVGLSKTYYDMYRIGVNVKVISGGGDLSTEQSIAQITTGEDIYQLDISTDYIVNTSFNSIDFNLRELIPFGNALYDNIGFSADFGFEYLGEGWKTSMSLLDVGYINWKSNVTNYTSKGEFQFDGFSFDDLTEDSLSVEWDNVKELFDVEENNDKYTTYTAPKLYIGAEYERGRWTYGGLFYSEWQRGRYIPAVAVNAKTKVWNVWELGASYAVKNRTYSNVGLSSVLNLGPIQLYALSDNVLGIFINPRNAKLNLRLGMNVDLKGKRKKMEINNPS